MWSWVHLSAWRSRFYRCPIASMVSIFTVAFQHVQKLLITPSSWALYHVLLFSLAAYLKILLINLHIVFSHQTKAGAMDLHKGSRCVCETLCPRWQRSLKKLFLAQRSQGRQPTIKLTTDRQTDGQTEQKQYVPICMTKKPQTIDVGT